MTYVHSPKPDNPHWSDILLQASRGNLSRYKERGHWMYRMNHKTIRTKSVLELMRRGYLEPATLGPPFMVAQTVDITVKGREQMRLSNGKDALQ